MHDVEETSWFENYSLQRPLINQVLKYYQKLKNGWISIHFSYWLVLKKPLFLLIVDILFQQNIDFCQATHQSWNKPTFHSQWPLTPKITVTINFHNKRSQWRLKLCGHQSWRHQKLSQGNWSPNKLFQTKQSIRYIHLSIWSSSIISSSFCRRMWTHCVGNMPPTTCEKTLVLFIKNM